MVRPENRFNHAAQGNRAIRGPVFGDLVRADQTENGHEPEESSGPFSRRSYYEKPPVLQYSVDFSHYMKRVFRIEVLQNSQHCYHVDRFIVKRNVWVHIEILLDDVHKGLVQAFRPNVGDHRIQTDFSAEPRAQEEKATDPATDVEDATASVILKNETIS